MKIVNEHYYYRVDKYIAGHIALSLGPDSYSGTTSYITTENNIEYRAILKLKKLTNYSMYKMCKIDLLDFGWEMIG